MTFRRRWSLARWRCGAANNTANKAEVPPNGLAFSCRERAGRCLLKPNDLAREAVNCNAMLGGQAA
jgi:hypothetical protein